MIRNLFYLTVSLFLFPSLTNAQPFQGAKPEKNVPNVVQTAFNSKFSDDKVVWFTHYEGQDDDQLMYEGRFMFDNRYSVAVYDRNGNLAAFVATLEYLEIPIKARQYMKDNFAGRTIVDARIVTRSPQDVTYEIGVVLENEYVVEVFSKDGDFIKSTRA